MNIDDIYEAAGDLGPQQLKYVLILCSFRMLRAMDMLNYVFVGRKVSFLCLFDDAGACDFKGSVTGTGGKMHDACPANDPDRCDRVVFDHGQDYGTTLAMEWRLICGDEWLVPLTMSIYVLGYTLGMSTLGPVSDKYGRKFTIFLSFGSMVLTNIMGAVSPTFFLYCATRLLNGYFCAGLLMSATVLDNELVGKTKRGLAAAIYTTGWAFGTMLLSLLAYFVPQWRTMNIVLSLFGVPFLLFYSYLPESPRWLFSKDRLSEANQVMKTIVEGNGAHYEDRFQLRKSARLEEAKEKQPVKMIECFRHRSLLIIFATLTYSWMVIFDLNQGLTVLAGTDSGNLYLGTALSGLVEVPGDYLALFLLGFFGRKYTVAGTLLWISLSLLSLFFVYDAPYMIVIVIMLGKMGASAAHQIFAIHTNEIFPTAIRSTAFGLISCVSRLGGMFFPYLVQLGQFYVNLQYLVLGLLSLLAAALNLRFLPETSGRNLPETMEDVFDLIRRK